MKKEALVGEALDAYSNLQAQHPILSTAAMMALHFIHPAIPVALQIPNIAQLFRYKQPYRAVGNIGSMAISHIPSRLGPGSRFIGSLASDIGGNVAQNYADADKTASYRSYHMSRLLTKTANPLALAIPAAKAVGGAIATGAAMTGGSMLAQKAIEKATAPNKSNMEGTPMPEKTGYAKEKAVFSQLSKIAANKVAFDPNDPSNAADLAKHLSGLPADASGAGMYSSGQRDISELPGVGSGFGGGIRGHIAAIPERVESMYGSAKDKANELIGKLYGSHQGPDLHATPSLGGVGGNIAMAGGGGALTGLGLGALLGDPAGGAGAGAGAGVGGALGRGGGQLLASILRSRGYDGMANALVHGGTAAGAGIGGGLGYMATHKKHEKESSYHPHMLLYSLTKAAYTR